VYSKNQFSVASVLWCSRRLPRLRKAGRGEERAENILSVETFRMSFLCSKIYVPVVEEEGSPGFEPWSSSNLERMAGMRLATVVSVLLLEGKAEVEGVGVKEGAR